MTSPRTKSVRKIQNMVRNSRTRKLMNKVSKLPEEELKKIIMFSIMKNEREKVEGLFDLFEYSPSLKEVNDYLNKHKPNIIRLLKNNILKHIYDNIFNENDESAKKFCDFLNIILYRINNNSIILRDKIKILINNIINLINENSVIDDRKGYEYLLSGIVKSLETNNINYNKQFIYDILQEEDKLDIAYYIIQNIKLEDIDYGMITNLETMNLDDENDYWREKINNYFK